MSHTFLREYPIVDPEFAYATHFGVVPMIVDLRSAVEPPAIDFDRVHNDPNEETILWRGPDVTAFVSGSWSCWGPADQETHGDMTLHVVVYTPKKPDQQLFFDLYAALAEDVSTGSGRIIDYALGGSAADWSVLTDVITFIGRGIKVSIFEIEHPTE